LKLDVLQRYAEAEGERERAEATLGAMTEDLQAQVEAAVGLYELNQL
jgi:hypothetical protein